jgi:putative tryptophan/tyrosine transport system substrate-binding protein
MAEEIVGLVPDVILASTNSVVSATLNVTRSIPVVFTWVSDPVRSGFVPNLPHPGGKITGFHNFEPAISGKWLAYLNQIAPGLRRVAVLHVPEIAPNVAFLRVVEAAAPQMGIAVWPAEIRNADDIERVLSDFKQQGAGLIVTPSALTATRRDLIEDRLRSHCRSRFDNQPPRPLSRSPNATTTRSLSSSGISLSAMRAGMACR